MNPQSRRRRGIGYAILLIPLLAVLWVPFYNRVEPRLFGVPFFYWSQFVWILVTAIVTAAVYLARVE